LVENGQAAVGLSEGAANTAGKAPTKAILGTLFSEKEEKELSDYIRGGNRRLAEALEQIERERAYLWTCECANQRV
jgi:hypothetical protein